MTPEEIRRLIQRAVELAHGGQANDAEQVLARAARNHPADEPEVGELPAARNGYITFGLFAWLAQLSGRTMECWSRTPRAARPRAPLAAVGCRRLGA